MHNILYGIKKRKRLLSIHLSPLYPGKHPPEQLPLVFEQFSDFRQYPHSPLQFEPYLPTAQAKGRDQVCSLSFTC